MDHALASALTPATLRRLAGSRFYERGEAYVDAGRVTRLEANEDSVYATVKGARRYKVTLRAGAGGELDFSCTCPIGVGGACCKHCVAAGLAALGDRDPSGPAPLTLDDVRAYVASLDREALASLVIEEARRDDRLLERLRLRVARGDSSEVNLATFREAIDLAVDPGGFVEYARAFDYAQDIERAIDALDELLGSGHPREAIELADYFLAAVEEVAGMMDDSDGHIGVILDRLQRLHHEGCVQATPDPVALAERLFERMLATEYDVFYDAVEIYADVLGDAGRERYAQLARAEWDRLPPLGPGDRREWGRRFRITHVMEQVASLSGDVDELAAIMQHDLSSPYSHLRIAQAYRDAGREDDALMWAERGMEAFPDRPDSRLTKFLADCYRRHDRHADALELMWDAFSERPGLGAWQDLKPYAERAGAWPERRDRALALLRERIASAQEEIRRRGYGWLPHGDSSELVRVFLWEEDVDSAWREAQEGGCSQDLWLTLAEQRKDHHPADALAVYRDQVEPTINRKTKADYRDAVALMEKVRELMSRLGREDEFPAYVADVRARHARKRTLLKLLDGLEQGTAKAAEPG